MSDPVTVDIAALLKSADDLLEAVSFDVNGRLLGGKWMGGNGGLVSSDTLRKCDVLRREIDTIKSALEGSEDEG